MVAKITRSAINSVSQSECFEKIPKQKVKNPIWVSVSTAAQIGGIEQKSIRRAIENDLVKFKTVKNRYSINLGSLIKYFYSKTKLKNKFMEQGLGQYIEKWK